MLTFEWNALRTGDRVCVHDDAEVPLTLLDGVVVEVAPGAGVNDVAVRVRRAGVEHDTVIRPRRRAMHHVPLDRRDSCWRCAEMR